MEYYYVTIGKLDVSKFGILIVAKFPETCRILN